MFRSLFSLTLLAASTAFAQAGPVYCARISGQPALIRAEGVAERVSDILITCTGGQAGVASTGTISLYLGDLYAPPLYNPSPNPTTATITGRLSPASNDSEAVLLVGDLATSPVVGGNVFQGVQPGTNVVVFNNVTLTALGVDQYLTLRIVNLRVDASDYAGTNVQVLADFTWFPSAYVSNSPAPLAIKAPGVLFALQTAAGAPAPSLSLPSTPGGAITHRLQFTEGFGQSFRKRNTGTSVATPTVLADQAVPATDYHTESGFYDSVLPSANSLNQAGLASQGTRLVVRFSNVPAGVNLYVTTGALLNTGATSAFLVAADSAGAGTVVTQTGWLWLNTLSGTTPASLQVTITPWNLVSGVTTGSIVAHLREPDGHHPGDRQRVHGPVRLCSARVYGPRHCFDSNSRGRDRGADGRSHPPVHGRNANLGRRGRT